MSTSRLQRIAEFIADSPRAVASSAAIERAKLALTDYTGVALAGSMEQVAKIIAGYVTNTSRGDATMIGTASRASEADAAFANAVAGHALDFDDSSFVLGGHPSVTLLPALLAVGESRNCNGSDVLDAYIVGFEVMMKFARAVNFNHYEKGWHPTATLGVFGTAAGVARLLRLASPQAAHTIGLAASAASGVKANFGAMAKPIQVGHASEQGVKCAQLAAAGATASAAALEGKQGFLSVYNGAGNFNADELIAFAETPEILASGLMFKKYPCCGATHAPIDAALALKRAHGLSADNLDAITITLNQRRVPHVDRPRVTTGLEAKFSVQYCISAALADGEIGLRHFGEAAIGRRDLQQLVGRVAVNGTDRGDDLSQACTLTVKLKDGKTCTIEQADADGRNVEAYVTYMETKFVDCVTQVADRALAGQLLSQLRTFENYTNVADFMKMLAFNADVEEALRA